MAVSTRYDTNGLVFPLTAIRSRRSVWTSSRTRRWAARRARSHPDQGQPSWSYRQWRCSPCEGCRRVPRTRSKLPQERDRSGSGTAKLDDLTKAAAETAGAAGAFPKQREYIYKLLQDGQITDEARRRIERELDLEEASIACKRGRRRGAALITFRNVSLGESFHFPTIGLFKWLEDLFPMCCA
jgi:hypothetical protein